MIDLKTNLCGIPLPHPLILASGPLSWNADGVRAAFEAGAAAVVTKTIRPEATVNPVPHIAAAGRGSMLNTEGWSDLPARQWIEEELPSLSNRSGVLIASTGHTPAEVAHLAAPLAETGVDMLELVSYRAEDAAPMVAAAKAATAIPILIKVSANWPNLIEVVKQCLTTGADGVTAIDSIGPALRIDVETGRPLLGSFAWYSGEAIRPIALRAVAEICMAHDIPVIGTGGISHAEHVVEMTMAGASAVGIHTAVLLKGLGWFGKTRVELENWLIEYGHTHLSSLCGVALPYLREEIRPSPLHFTFDMGACTRCQRCITVCAYGARRLLPDRMSLNKTLCRSCGLCTTICPTNALKTM